jgi:hypothetical protein
MKKLAICISGSLRSLEICNENFIKNIFIPNKQNYDITLFLYLPNDINSAKISLLSELNPIYTINDDVVLKEPNLIWRGRPISTYVDNVSQGGIQGYLQQLYGIEKSFELMVKYEKEHHIKFDFILRCRSDVIYKTPINIDQYNLNKIILPKFHSYRGVNDRFAVGNREIMVIYMKMYSYIYTLSNEYISKDKKLNIFQAEFFCKLNLDIHEIDYQITNTILFNRVRMGNKISNDC